MTGLAAVANYTVGQKVTAAKVSLRTSETRPPPFFTTATLVDAMRDVDKFVPDPNDQRVLRDSEGIGTARTRDDVIAKLIKSGQCYLDGKGKGKEGKGKKLPPLRPGREAIALVQLLQTRGIHLADPVMTAKWEMALKLVETGKIQSEQFLGQIRSFVSSVVGALRTQGIPAGLLGTPDKSFEARPEVEKLPGDGDVCPECKKGTLATRVVNKEGQNKGKRFLACSQWKSGCKYKAWE